jgi:peptidoglycan/LPS O-acetylase OafA/YrhL
MQVEVPGAQTLATLSYSLYLSHKLALHAAGEWGASQSPAVAVVAEVVVVLLAGLSLHHAVERPFLRLRARGG